MNSPFELTLWQKKQAALLYRFASLDYLKGLQQRVNELIAIAELTLDRAKSENRDALLTNQQWGSRNTSENWANVAWPFLASFRESNAWHIANRAVEIYGITRANQCARAMDEFSMQWATPDEENKFKEMFEAVYRYASNIDDTMDKSQRSPHDFWFAKSWQEFKGEFQKLPKFRVRTDVEGVTDKVPVRTGVYVPQDEPHGSLQFAWTGGGNGKLTKAQTFNELGLDAINAVGRDDLWLDEHKMFAFATSRKYDELFKNNVFFRSEPAFDLAPAAVSRQAFTGRACKWYYVELISGEFEDIDNSATKKPTQQRLRVEAGEQCPQAGYWFAAAQANSRRPFKEGEVMPVIGSDYGSTIWQWDSNQ